MDYCKVTQRELYRFWTERFNRETVSQLDDTEKNDDETLISESRLPPTTLL